MATAHDDGQKLEMPCRQSSQQPRASQTDESAGAADHGLVGGHWYLDMWTSAVLHMIQKLNTQNTDFYLDKGREGNLDLRFHYWAAPTVDSRSTVDQPRNRLASDRKWHFSWNRLFYSSNRAPHISPCHSLSSSDERAVGRSELGRAHCGVAGVGGERAMARLVVSFL